MKWLGWIPKEGDLRSRWQRFFEEFQLLGSQFERQRRGSRDVSAGTGKAGNQSAPDRITNDRHNNRNRAGGFFGGLGSSTAFRNDNVHPETDQLGGEVGKAREHPLRISTLDDDVAALNIAEIAQRLLERLPVGTWSIAKNAYSPNFPALLLSERRKRRNERTCAQRTDKFAASIHRDSLGRSIAELFRPTRKLYGLSGPAS